MTKLVALHFYISSSITATTVFPKWIKLQVSDRKMSRLDSFLSIVCSYGIDPSQSTILDIGCGNGRFTLELSRVFQKVVTIDSSDTVIQKLLRKMEAENITNISGNNCLNE